MEWKGQRFWKVHPECKHTKHLDPAKAFWLVLLYFLPYGGIDHMSALIAVSVRARRCTCRGALACSSPPRHVLFPLVCVQAGREAVGRIWWKDCKMWMRDRNINSPWRSGTPNRYSLSSREDNILLQTSALLLDFNQVISSNSHDCT